jgi:hypothetical protein
MPLQTKSHNTSADYHQMTIDAGSMKASSFSKHPYVTFNAMY